MAQEQKLHFYPLNVHTAQHTLFVETLGNSSFPACILIPGSMQGAWGWSDDFCRKIAEAGFYVVRFDHRDIGRSSATPENQVYSLVDLAKDVIAILDELKVRQAHFVGHSMGGHLCQQLALDYPARVLSICPIASGPIGDTAETGKPLTDSEQALMNKTWEVFLARKDAEDPEAHLQGFISVYKHLNGTIPLDEPLARSYVSSMLNCSPKRYLQPGNPHEKVMQHLAETLENRKGALKKIRCPTLIIHGELDPLCPPRLAASMAKEIPGTKLKIIPGMGHMFLSRKLEDVLTDAIIAHMRSHPILR